jgi:hypothetical protein
VDDRPFGEVTRPQYRWWIPSRTACDIVPVNLKGSAMVNVPDDITLGRLCRKAAQALARAGLDRRIDIYREVEIDDPAVQLMLGRPHRLRVRVKITASSLLFEGGNEQQANADAAETESGGESSVIGTLGPMTSQR